MPIPRPDPYHDEITRLWRSLGDIGAKIIPAKLATSPEPDDIGAIRDDLDVLCRNVDRLVLAYGEYLNSRTSHKIDLTSSNSLWKDQLAGALDGQAFHEIEEAAQDIRDQAEMMDADAAYDAWRDAKMERA